MIIARMEKVEAAARAATRELEETAERESLRPFAMLDASGAQVHGAMRTAGGEVWNAYKDVFEVSGTQVTWSCADDGIAKLNAAIQKQPRVPYALAARAECFKKRGDPRWREDGEHCRMQAAKIQEGRTSPRRLRPSAHQM